MQEKLFKLINAYWRFDDCQQPLSNWHDKQDLLVAIENLFKSDSTDDFCNCSKGKGIDTDDNGITDIQA